MKTKFWTHIVPPALQQASTFSLKNLSYTLNVHCLKEEKALGPEEHRRSHPALETRGKCITCSWQTMRWKSPRAKVVAVWIRLKSIFLDFFEICSQEWALQDNKHSDISSVSCRFQALTTSWPRVVAQLTARTKSARQQWPGLPAPAWHSPGCLWFYSLPFLLNLCLRAP